AYDAPPPFLFFHFEAAEGSLRIFAPVASLIALPGPSDFLCSASEPEGLVRSPHSFAVFPKPTICQHNLPLPVFPTTPPDLCIEATSFSASPQFLLPPLDHAGLYQG